MEKTKKQQLFSNYAPFLGDFFGKAVTGAPEAIYRENPICPNRSQSHICLWQKPALAGHVLLGICQLLAHGHRPIAGGSCGWPAVGGTKHHCGEGTALAGEVGLRLGDY